MKAAPNLTDEQIRVLAAMFMHKVFPADPWRPRTPDCRGDIPSTRGLGGFFNACGHGRHVRPKQMLDDMERRVYT